MTQYFTVLLNMRCPVELDTCISKMETKKPRPKPLAQDRSLSRCDLATLRPLTSHHRELLISSK